jgi:hypothetical protein
MCFDMMEKTHTKYLDSLIMHLQNIDENPQNVQWVMKEGFLFANNSLDSLKLCDLLIGFYDGTGLCVELKRSHIKYEHACKQLENGYNLMIHTMGYRDVRKKIVFYGGGSLSYEIIE